MSDTYIDKKTKSGFEFDSELNDTEYVPFKERVEDYYLREVVPFVPDAWYENVDVDEKTAKVGCEISFNKYFSKYVPPRNSDDILNEIKENESSEEDLWRDLYGN